VPPSQTDQGWIRRIAADGLFVASCLPFALVIAIFLNCLRANPLPLVREAEDLRLARSVGKAVSLAEHITVETLDLEGALSTHANGEDIWVDARDEEFYSISRVAGARNLSKRDFAIRFSAFERDTPGGKSVVVYCSGIDCDDAMIVARALKRLGYERVRVFVEGWEEWEKAGLPEEP
jgi:rhodanese-related sulfurtransferase